MLFRKLKLYLLLISIFSLTACVENFFIIAEGQINQEIVFRFYKLDEMKPTAAPYKVKGVNYISVDEYIDGKEWKKVWELRGESKDSIDHILYGYNYSGLKEVVSADTLKMDAKYRIFVSKPGVNGGGAFYFDHEGKTVVIDH